MEQSFGDSFPIKLQFILLVGVREQLDDQEVCVRGVQLLQLARLHRLLQGQVSYPSL